MGGTPLDGNPIIGTEWDPSVCPISHSPLLPPHAMPSNGLGPPHPSVGWDSLCPHWMRQPPSHPTG